MSKPSTTFIGKCLSGDALYEDIDDYIDLWHNSDSEEKLHEFLGMTHDEYIEWVKHPDILPSIIANHNKVSI